MKYKFVSREQTKKDWEEGKVQCEHGAAGKSEKLDKLFGHSFYAGRYEHYNYIDGRCNYNSNIPTATTDELYEWIYGEGEKQKEQDNHYIHNTFMENADVWTDTHDWVMTKGKFEAVIKDLDFSKISKQKYEPQEQRELLGYKLNGKRTEEQIADFLNTFPSAVRELSIKEDNKLIQLASELGVLSTCFEPIYKPYQIEIKLSDYNVSVEKDIAYLISLDKKAEWPITITDLKKIIEAHDKL